MIRSAVLAALMLLAGCGGGGSSSTPYVGNPGVGAPQADLTPTMQLFTTVPGQPLNMPPKTDYWAYPTTIDMETLDVVNSAGRYRNPSNFGTYALPSSRGDYTERRTRFDAECNQFEPLSEVQKLGIRRMQETATPLGQGVTWLYDFPALGTDYIINAPYPSAYSQAINIHGLLFGHCKTGDPALLDLARKAGLGMLVPIQQGGMTNTFDGFTWYEELVGPKGYNPYIFNGHVYAVLSLFMLGEATGDQVFTQAAQRGVDSLNQLLPLFDSGEWSKYDLRPPSPTIYVELHAENADAVTMISGTVNGEAYTLCHEGCTQTLNSARANNSFRFNMNLPSLREFHGSNTAIALSSTTSEPTQTEWRSLSMRPVGGEVMLSQPDATLTLNEIGWGQTQEAYQVWHSLLMEELYGWTGDPLHSQTAQRWRAYLAQMQASL